MSHSYTEFEYKSLQDEPHVHAVLGVRASQLTGYSAYIIERGKFYNELMPVTLNGKSKLKGDIVLIVTSLGWFQLSTVHYNTLCKVLEDVIPFTPLKELTTTCVTTTA